MFIQVFVCGWTAVLMLGKTYVLPIINFLNF